MRQKIITAKERLTVELIWPDVTIKMKENMCPAYER